MKRLFRITVVWALFVTLLSFAGCNRDNSQPDWLVKPTAVVSPEMAITHVAQLLELPEDLFYSPYLEGKSEKRTESAVTEKGSRINGFAVSLCEPLWNEDVSFFLVTRDYRVYFNLSGEYFRDGVPLISRYEDGVFTLLDVIDEPDETPDETPPDTPDETPPEIPDDIPDDTPPPLSSLLDKSSPQAFTDSIWEIFIIVLTDDEDFLSEENSSDYMDEIEHALMLFSPEFMRTMVSYYHREYSSTYFINISGYNEDLAGLAKRAWYPGFGGNVSVTLFFDSDAENCGITAPVLAHEIAHTVHYLIEDFTDAGQIEKEMQALNGDFIYVDVLFNAFWNEALHSTTFANEYGMHCHYEDIASIIGLLVGDPDGMAVRLSDPQNEPLFLKTQYIREMFYEYISDDCFLVFAPLYNAEGNIRT
ncbi:MAG: hypothetical protein LBC82_04065 [Oscillospiraceae bacterium]|jgi:hypothetical protein|nr:hypothetical protein [Oscillospiraceae bacterium]